MSNVTELPAPPFAPPAPDPDAPPLPRQPAPHPNFWWALLWCVFLVLITQIPAALVAVQPSTGQLLAVANAPADSSFDRALSGQYPPGSSFKIVTTTALIPTGVTPDTPVACPPSVTRSQNRISCGRGA